jgi:hypothetical protein
MRNLTQRALREEGTEFTEKKVLLADGSKVEDEGFNTEGTEGRGHGEESSPSRWIKS